MSKLGYLLLVEQVQACSQATCLTYYFSMYSKIMTKIFYHLKNLGWALW